MHASNKFIFKTALAPLWLALVLAAPGAFAKKDLFGNEPGSKQPHQIEQLIPNASSSSSSQEQIYEETSAELAMQEKTKSAIPEAKPVVSAEAEKKNSYLETQFVRFKENLVEAKEDLFGKKKEKKAVPAAPQQTEANATDSAHSSEDAQPEIPTISATEAAQRAQTFVEGQVINVRKYQDEGKPRYAVKLLQKNGRMKTINLDAVSGALIEETPQ